MKGAAMMRHSALDPTLNLCCRPAGAARPPHGKRQGPWSLVLGHRSVVRQWPVAIIRFLNEQNLLYGARTALKTRWLHSYNIWHIRM